MQPVFAVLADAGRGIPLGGAPTLLPSLCTLPMLRAGMLSARGGLDDDDDDEDDVTDLGAWAGDWYLLAMVLWPIDPPKLLTSSPPPSRELRVSSRSRMVDLDTGVPLVPMVDRVT